MDARVPQPKHVCRCTVQGRGSRARRAAARDCQSRLCVCMRESPPSAVRAPVRARHAHTRAAQSARGSGCRLRRGYHLECQWSFAERSGRSARQAVSEFRAQRGQEGLFIFQVNYNLCYLQGRCMGGTGRTRAGRPTYSTTGTGPLQGREPFTYSEKCSRCAPRLRSSRSRHRRKRPATEEHSERAEPTRPRTGDMDFGTAPAAAAPVAGKRTTRAEGGAKQGPTEFLETKEQGGGNQA